MTQTNKTQGTAQITIQGDQQVKHSLGQQLAEFLRGRGHSVEMGGALKTPQTPQAGQQPQTGNFQIGISDEPQTGQSSQSQSRPQT